MFCKLLWIVLCVAVYPVDCVMCCRFLWIVLICSFFLSVA